MPVRRCACQTDHLLRDAECEILLAALLQQSGKACRRDLVDERGALLERLVRKLLALPLVEHVEVLAPRHVLQQQAAPEPCVGFELTHESVLRLDVLLDADMLHVVLGDEEEGERGRFFPHR